MEYTTLGDTGMTVSRICLGCMSFNEDGEGWNVDRATATDIVDRAVDLGINFFDTANVYQAGESESILGDALAAHDRDAQVIATKVRFPSSNEHENAAGLSRKTVEQELALSRERLGVDTIDLYQIHRWDDDTPVAETLRVLDDAVRRGHVRYVGASSMWAYQFAEMLHESDRRGLERFVSMQNHYNPVYREEEREMLPLCEREGIGVVPWSPLARGYLARPDAEHEATTRGEQEAEMDRFEERLANYRARGGREINRRVQELADERGVSMAQITLAWHLHQDAVTAPIVGVSSVDHLEDAAEAVEIDLSADDLDYLAKPYEPKAVDGHD
ncbi:MAG: aldo/keto reductase [Halobacteriaceae archaeon]